MGKIKNKENGDAKYRQKAIEHFLLSIIDAKLAYTLFKSLYLSRFENIVGKVLAEKYLWIQKQYGGFFVLVEHCAFNAFIIKILHGFDNNDDSLTLKDIDEKSYLNFINENENKKIIKEFRIIRNKRIAHFNKKIKITLSMPSFLEIDLFFKRLEKFYDDLAKKIKNASVMREQDQDLKDKLDIVFRDLFIGRKVRLLNIGLKYDWQENNKNISKTDLL